MQPEAHSSPSSADAEAYRAQLAEVLQQNGNLSRQNLQLRQENADQQQRLRRLEEKLAALQRLYFGPRSERFVPEPDPQQRALFEESGLEAPLPPAEPEGVDIRPGRRKSKRHPRRPLQLDHLPREEITLEPDEDTTGLVSIGAEETRLLEYEPARFKVLVYTRPKYSDPRNPDRGVIMAELPPRLIEKGMAGEGLLAHVVVDKYVDHLPLYRQHQRFKREGIDLPKSTLGEWIAHTAWHLVPLYEALMQEALSSGYLQADETTIQVQDRNKPGKTHRGYYWAYHTPEQKLFVMEYRKSRARAGPVAFLRRYAGLLQTDGYAAYEAFDVHPSITTYGCMAHARRKFSDCFESEPEKARYVLEQIKLLYKIERRLRERSAGAEERRQVRQDEAKPVLEALKTWLEANPGLPRSGWGIAVRYMLGRWAKLTRYLEEGRVEIDNNLIENGLRPLALGRKNYLFAGSHEAAQRAAVVYSLLGTCKLHGVNPWEWLADVFRRIPTHPAKLVADLLPHRWHERRQAEEGEAA